MSGVDAPARAAARRWWAGGALALALLVVGLDMTVLNLALPWRIATHKPAQPPEPAGVTSQPRPGHGAAV